LLLNSGGATWDIASLDGSLTIACPVVNIANVATPDTWRTLNLHGPAGGVISGTITDNAAGTSKTNLKVVSGNWELAGAAKEYTGSTTLEGGTLNLNTTLVSSNTTVRNGAVLTGNGTVGGNLTVQTGAAIACRFADWESPPTGITAGQLIATGATTWTLRFECSGLEGFSEVARTIPIVSARGGFTNLNTSAIIIDTPGFPGTGKWSVSSNGNTLALVYEPNLYAAWTGGRPWEGKDSEMESDPDADGVTNLMEYALGGNPLDAASIPVPVSAINGGRLSLSFQRVADPDLLYEVLASDGLIEGSWQAVWSSTGASNTPGTVIVEDTPPTPLPECRFLRLRVSRPASSGTP
jgi:autotransporter-associated beta strand protein